MKMVLRHFNYLINKDNLEDAILGAIEEISSEDCKGFFQNCHYYVQGREYRPYLGPKPLQ